MSDFRCEGNKAAYGGFTGQLPHTASGTPAKPSGDQAPLGGFVESGLLQRSIQ
jgi:hypothetical protein